MSSPTPMTFDENTLIKGQDIKIKCSTANVTFDITKSKHKMDLVICLSLSSFKTRIFDFWALLVNNGCSHSVLLKEPWLYPSFQKPTVWAKYEISSIKLQKRRFSKAVKESHSLVMFLKLLLLHLNNGRSKRITEIFSYQIQIPYILRWRLETQRNYTLKRMI